MLRIKDPITIIVALAALQVLSSTYFLDIPDFYGINSFLFLLSGIGITVCLLKIPPIEIQKTEIVNKQLLLKILIIAVLLPVSYQLARHIMDENPF